MNIIGGIAKNTPLLVPKGEAVRPTLVRARKALFDSLAPWEGRAVLDLFAGSGALGLEAASRGAAQVCFVEKNPRHCAVLQRNIDAVSRSGLGAQFRVVNGDVCSLPPHTAEPDLIFADPPYADSPEMLHRLLESPFFGACAPGTRLVWEIPDEHPELKMIQATEKFCVENIRRYGPTWFIVLKKEEI